MTEPNTLFPGRPSYTGPTEGYFGFLHHCALWEHSKNVKERVDYVMEEKPPEEIPIRLHNMIYLGEYVKASPFFRDEFDSIWAEHEKATMACRKEYVDKIQEITGLIDEAATQEMRQVYMDYRKKSLEIQMAYQKKLEPENVKVLAYIKEHIPDCAWDGSRLVFK